MQAQVDANKRIATLAIRKLSLKQAKAGQEEQEAKQSPPEFEQRLFNNRDDDPINPDPRAEAWASKNSWFGQIMQ